MIRCLIVDDEQHSIDVLEHYIGQCNFLALAASTTSPIEALNEIAAGSIDLLFLDVHMPDISGLDVIQSISGKCKVILTTAYPEYALQGYNLGVIDYLLKPISYPRFLQAIQKFGSDFQVREEKSTAKAEHGHIYIKTGLKNNVIRINYNEIEYIESLKNYAAIFHGGKKTVAYLSMKDLEATLPADQFLRIHKSFIISLSRINRVEGNEVELAGIRNRINIGESYRARLWTIIRERILG